MTSQNAKIYIGIDVSKAMLDVFISIDQSHQQYDNTVSGIKKLMLRLKKSPKDQSLIVMEATGGYEKVAARVLVKNDFIVTVVNPRTIRPYAKACGQLAKTDKIDAKLIAAYAEIMQPKSRSVFNKKHDELAELSARRSQLIGVSVAEKNRLDKVSSKIEKSILKLINFVEKQIAEIDEELKRIIESDATFNQKYELLKTVKGIGVKSATALIAYLPELGVLGDRQITALAGLAPYNCDSGKMRGKRMIWGGRSAVRTSLYMATMAAIRSNKAIRAFNSRLIGAGKPKMVALTACMRKLIIIMNAMIRNNIPWRENYAEIKSS